MSKSIVYVVMSIRFEEYSDSAPDNAIATHGAYSIQIVRFRCSES